MNANNLLFQFTEHLKVINRSEATIKAYTANVRHFLEEKKRNVKTITRSDMETYIAGIHVYRMADGKGYSQGSISVKIRSLKRFFEFLEEKNIIFIDPMEYIHEPTPDRTLPRNILTVLEMEKLLDQPNLGLKTGIRDRTVLEVFYSTGVRLGELCSLTIYDADLQGRMLRINKGKGQKDRVVPLGKHAIRFLREYITKIRPHLTKRNKKSRALFVNQLGQPLSRQVVQIMVRTNAKKAGLTKKVSPHTLRHTFASQLVKNGADVVAVQKMLGHADLSTTQGYIKALAIDLKKVHARSHPRERDKVDRRIIKPKIIRKRAENGSYHS